MNKQILILSTFLLASHIVLADAEDDFVAAQAKTEQQLTKQLKVNDSDRIEAQITSAGIFEKNLLVERKKHDSDQYGRNYFISSKDKACQIFISSADDSGDSTSYLGTRPRSDSIVCYAK
jgi:hypothetical protein